jgi:hypothetical protein
MVLAVHQGLVVQADHLVLVVQAVHQVVLALKVIPVFKEKTVLVELVEVRELLVQVDHQE